MKKLTILTLILSVLLLSISSPVLAAETHVVSVKDENGQPATGLLVYIWIDTEAGLVRHDTVTDQDGLCQAVDTPKSTATHWYTAVPQQEGWNGPHEPFSVAYPLLYYTIYEDSE